MFLNELSHNPRYFWNVCITVVISVCLHELSHGVAAICLGDRTPIETGHMTLNPVKHMGIYSLILLLTAGIAWGSMPITPSRLRGPHARAIVALCGPLCNIVLAMLSLFGLGFWLRLPDMSADGHLYLHNFLLVFGIFNIALAIFNMIPIPPLDGSKVLADFSGTYADLMKRLQQGGQSMIGFMIVFYFAGDLIFPVATKIGLRMLEIGRGY